MRNLALKQEIYAQFPHTSRKHLRHHVEPQETDVMRLKNAHYTLKITSRRLEKGLNKCGRLEVRSEFSVSNSSPRAAALLQRPAASTHMNQILAEPERHVDEVS